MRSGLATRLLAALMAILLAVPLAAQAGRSLVRIDLAQNTATRAVATLVFDAMAPEARINGNDTNKITVILLGTSRGAAARLDIADEGLLRGVTFSQDPGSLQMVLTLSAPAHLDVKTDLPRRFTFRLDSIGPAAAPRAGSDTAEDTPAAGAAGTPLPPALNPPPGADGAELIRLNFADVSEVVGLLSENATVRSNNSFLPREPGFGSLAASGSGGQTQQTNETVDDRPLGQPVDQGLAVNRRLNAIWVRGTPEYIARIKALIAKIDIPLTSVILETEFVELTEAGAKAIGIDFANASGQLAVATVQSGQFRPLNDYSPGQGRVDSLALQAALYAQVQRGEGRIISKPKISAQSGGTAKIITGDALPILTAITLSGVNGVSQQVQYVNVGVTLQIAPRVSADGIVTSHVFCVVSSVSGYSQGYPTISQREAQTSATVRDGEAFVIGGLIQDSELKSTAKVPILGDIPVLGRAFKYERSTKAKTELYIVITPHIVRNLD